MPQMLQYHRSRNLRILGSLTCVIALCCTIRLPAVAVTVQSTSLDQQVETTEKPKITVSGASSVSITQWDKLELSIKADVAGGVLTGNEIQIAKNNDRIDIICPPANFG